MTGIMDRGNMHITYGWRELFAGTYMLYGGNTYSTDGGNLKARHKNLDDAALLSPPAGDLWRVRVIRRPKDAVKKSVYYTDNIIS